jgi:photosynthetic reaction center H subunit
MQSVAFTQTIDVALVVTYAFFLFFVGLVIYLRREDKREGYPLDSDRTRLSGGRIKVQGWPAIPKFKTFIVHHDATPHPIPRPERDLTGLLAPTEGYPGAPFRPLGDPMQDGVGPASYAERLDMPDMTFDEHLPKIVPLRVAHGYYLAAEDPDPRGMDVVTLDGVIAGKVVDAWVDRSETFVRFLEVEPAAGGQTVLVPMLLSTIDAGRRRVRVKSVTAPQLAAAPRVKHPDQVTLLEEDRIAGYFAGGHLYATPDRLGPVL